MHDEGGDPACWLGAVCDRCGALVAAEPHWCRVSADRDDASAVGPQARQHRSPATDPHDE